jgi:hypothetical protein
LAASTQFDTDLGVARAVGCLALPKHTMTASATVRWRGYSGAGHTTLVYDSGTLSMSWSAETAESLAGLNYAHVHVPAAAQTARYWFTEITDTGNPAGYVDVARLVIAGAYQPAINMSYGAALGIEDDSTRLLSDGGAAIPNAKSKRRTFAGVLDNIAEAEALGSFWRMQKNLGTTGQLFFVFDPADTTYKHERAFLAVLRAPSALENPWLSRHRAAFSLVEEL